MVKLRHFAYGLISGIVLTAIVYLNGWNKGFDVGYGAAMSDVLLNIKSPEDFFNQFLSKPKRCDKNECHR